MRRQTNKHRKCMISLNIIIISLFNTWNQIAESQGKLSKLETCLNP